MPLFKFDEGASRKFYRIGLVGTRVKLPWGRIGSAGKEQVLEFESAAAAQRELDQQCSKRKPPNTCRAQHFRITGVINHQLSVANNPRITTFSCRG